MNGQSGRAISRPAPPNAPQSSYNICRFNCNACWHDALDPTVMMRGLWKFYFSKKLHGQPLPATGRLVRGWRRGGGGVAAAAPKNWQTRKKHHPASGVCVVVVIEGMKEMPLGSSPGSYEPDMGFDGPARKWGAERSRKTQVSVWTRGMCKTVVIWTEAGARPVYRRSPADTKRWLSLLMIAARRRAAWTMKGQNDTGVQGVHLKGFCAFVIAWRAAGVRCEIASGPASFKNGAPPPRAASAGYCRRQGRCRRCRPRPRPAAAAAWPAAPCGAGRWGRGSGRCWRQGGRRPGT